MHTISDRAIEQLLAAPAEPPTALATAYARRALVRVLTLPGLRVAPLSPDQRIFVAAHDGKLLGYLVPGKPGQVLGGWSATFLGGEHLAGPYPLARVAAGALLRLARGHVCDG
jgi:hypothetical protein